MNYKFNIRKWSIPSFVILFSFLGISQVTSGDIDAIIESEIIRQEIPGIAIGVYKKGEINYTKGYGHQDLDRKIPVTDKTILSWASISKTLTAVAALQLDEQNVNFSIEDRVIEHYPYWTAGSPNQERQKLAITIADLLQHKSGINHYGDGIDKKDAYDTKDYTSDVTGYDANASVNIFKDTNLDFYPGSDTLYTTYGYSLLGATIDKVAKGYPEWVSAKIKRPLGMTSLRAASGSTIGFEKINGIWKERSYHGGKNVLAGGGWQSDVKDLLKFGKGILDGKLLKQKERLWTVDKKLGYQGLYVSNTKNGFRVWHEGSHPNVKTILYLMPKEDIVIAIMVPVGKQINEHVVRPLQIVTPLLKSLGQDVKPVVDARNKCGEDDRATDKKFAVVWHKSSQDAIIRRGYDKAGFYAQWERLIKAGYQCVDIETYKIGNARKWDGIFKKQSGKSAMWRDYTYEGFKQKWQEMSKKGYRLMDVETYMSPNGRKWAGIFVSGTGKYAMFRNLTTDTFGQKKTALASKGYKLIDIEAYEDKGVLKWAGVWIEGVDGKLNRNYSHSDFEKKHRQWESQGYVLIDVEPYRIKGKLKWAGIWEKKNISQKINSNLGFCKILEKNDTWEKSGHEMMDIEVY